MERIQNSETIAYYDEDGNSHSTSTVTVRELDDGEIGTLSADKPDPTPPMLDVPVIHYDISDTESDLAEDTNHNCSHKDDPMDDNWFPSLSKASWIQDLDKNDSGDDDTLMTDRTMETLFASDIVEIGDDDDNNSASATTRHERPKKSRRTNHGPATLDPMDKNYMDDDVVINDSYNSLENISGLVPLDVIYDVLND